MHAKPFLLCARACLAAFALLGSPVMAHHGQYRGPKNEFPGRMRLAGPLDPSDLFGADLDRANSRRFLDSLDGDDRWEFWWEHRKDLVIWSRTAGPPTEDPIRSLDYFLSLGRLQGRPHSAPPGRDTVRDRVLPALRRALTHADGDVKAAALIALGRCGVPDARAEIRPYLRSPDPTVSQAAMLGTCSLPDNPAFYDLASLFLEGGEAPWRRSSAVLALGLQGHEKAAQVVLEELRRGWAPALRDGKLRDLLEDGILALGFLRDRVPVPELVELHRKLVTIRPSATRSEAALVVTMGQTEDPVVVDALLAAAADPRNQIRRAAAMALGGVDDPRASAALSRLLQADGDLQARSFAAVSLGRIGGEAAVNLLARALDDCPQNVLRSFCALGLALAGDGASAPRIRRLLETKHPSSVRGAAAVALGLLGDDAAVPALVDIVGRGGEDPDLRGYAAMGLGLMSAWEAHGALHSVATGANVPPLLQSRALLSLGLLGDPRDTPSFIGALGADLPLEVRASAATAIGLIRDVSAVDPLIRMALEQATREDPVARGLACVALGYLAMPVRVPSLAHLADLANYRQLSKVVEEMLDVL